jgi:starch synthase (maltosyl-transferring)
VIENIRPSVDGRFPVKRVVGESLVVEADCFADGHDVIVCELLWRRAGADAWTRQRMQALGNDRWRAVRVVESLGDWQYTVQAWVDPFLSWRHDFERRPRRCAVLAGGAALIEQAAARAAAAPK